MSAKTSPVVILERVSRRFGTQLALDSVSTCIRPGEFVAIIGRSGAGKTTLLRCLSRAIVPPTGAIRMGGQDLRPLAGARRSARTARASGVIYQQFNLVKRLRVLDNVLVGRLPAPPRLAALGRAGPGPSTASSGTSPCAASTTSASSAAPGSAPTRCRAASSSGWPSPRSWPRSRSSSWATSRWRASTSSTGPLVMETLRRIASRAGLTVISTLHHVEYARRYADRVLGLRGGPARVRRAGPPSSTDARHPGDLR